MKKDEVKIGSIYKAKVSKRVVEVRIDSTNTHGGWNATNTATGKCIRIKSAQRLRGLAGKKRTTVKDVVVALHTDASAADVPKADRPGGKAHRENAEQTADAARGESTTEKAAKPAEKRKGKVQKADGEAKPKRVSALNAAAQVLQNAGQPMRAQEMIAAMAKQGLWSSPNGKTPHATLYAAILREIAAKGAAARFRKVERGQFEFSGKGA